MIEVTLGIGLIAFGLVGALGVIPASLTAGRDSVAQSYASDSADEFLHFFASRLRDPTGAFQNWQTWGKTLPTSKPGATEPTVWTSWFSESTVQYLYGGTQKEFYSVVQKAAGTDRADFAAVYRVWRDSVTYAYYEAGTWVTATASEDLALGINVEVSWPASIPYERRQKALFRLEVFKPQA